MTLETVKVARNRKLDRRRGLAWEDELTAYLMEFPLTDAYNLGGSTTHIPDIVVFSNYIFDPKKSFLADGAITVEGISGPAFLPTKFITDHFVMAVECKFTEKDHYIIDKAGIDKCFEFISRTARYQRFVMLAFKFKLSAKKSRKYFVLLKYDPYFLQADYDYFRADSNGEFNFYLKGVNKSKPPRPHQYLNRNGFGSDRMKLVYEGFDLDAL